MTTLMKRCNVLYSFKLATKRFLKLACKVWLQSLLNTFAVLWKALLYIVLVKNKKKLTCHLWRLPILYHILEKYYEHCSAFSCVKTWSQHSFLCSLHHSGTPFLIQRTEARNILSNSPRLIIQGRAISARHKTPLFTHSFQWISN